MRLLITGAAGMLGRAVARHARARGHEVRAPGRDALDITDVGAVDATVAAARPDAVINCAAWTDVDGAESDPDRADAANASGAGLVARAATAVSAATIQVSTDYVFAGDGDRPYVESDPTAPRSAYGRSKLAGEAEVLAAAPRAAVVRTSWLFGAGGRNFVDTMLALGSEREQISVVDDQLGCPTWTGHLAAALLDLAERRASGVYHVAGSGSCTWCALAREIFAQAGLQCQVEPTTTAALGRPAPRPAFSVLGTERPDAPRLPSWQQGLRGHLIERDEMAGAPS